MKKLKTPLLILVICVIFCIFFLYYNSPARGGNATSSFTVKQGESVKSIARNLKSKGIIRSDFFFVTLTRLTGKARSIKSGHYNLRTDMRNTQVLQVLSMGIVATEKFTIPEGYTIKQIAAYLEEKGITSSELFLDACYNKDILSRYRIPFKSLEGFLFPDTYIVAKDLSAQQLVEVMLRRFFETIEKMSYTPSSEEEFKKVIIVASLVEKEVKVDYERELVSAVFYNRLKKGKRLESCATIQYIIGETKQKLLYSDLRIESPYNTYLNSGLPPGPIANPGYKSLFAAIHPADVDYLFFVSKRDGSHHFSSTYDEHLKAINQYDEADNFIHHMS
ncbi:MAG: hypothetical protein AMS17_01645 [Spirochaetes bacterium DG_61]|nr:MAG: hypothetical protein AMS17_01645 [Spirochaetes bacterium DG_61]